MLLADNIRLQNAAGGVERVNRRIDAQLGDLTAQHRRRIQVSERGCRRRVGQVVSRHVNGLHRGDRTFLGGGNTLLHLAHVGSQRRLITHRGGNTTQQRRDLGARLGKAEDIVHEEEHVLAFFITKVFRLGQTGQRDTRTRTRRLVHLAVDQRRLGVAVDVDNAGFHHLVIEVVTLAGPLSNAGENRVAAVGFRDVVDQLHDQHGLTDTGAPEQANLAALRVRRQQVDDLDAGDQNLGLGRLIDVFRRGFMDRRGEISLERTQLVNRLTDDVHDATQRARPDRHGNRLAGVRHLLATNQTFGRIHGDGAHDVLAEVLRHFQNQPLVVVSGLESVQDLRQVAFELHVHHRSHDLGDLAGLVIGHRFCSLAHKLLHPSPTSLPWRKRSRSALW